MGVEPKPEHNRVEDVVRVERVFWIVHAWLPSAWRLL